MTSSPSNTLSLGLVIKTKYGEEKNVLLVAEDQKNYVVGRSSIGKNKADIPVSDKHVSKRHCEIYWKKNEWLVLDLDTTNGTIMNGDLLIEPTKITVGDEILLGTTKITISSSGEIESPNEDETQVLTEVKEPYLTVILDEEDEATIAIDNNDETIVIDTDETLVSDGSDYFNENETIIEDEISTVISAEDKAVLPDEDATVIGEEDATVIVVENVKVLTDNEATILSGDDATLLSDIKEDAQTVSVETVENGSDTTVISDGDKVSKTGSDNVAKLKKKQDSSDEYDDDDLSELSGIAVDLMDASLIDEVRCMSLINSARDSGSTFFRALANDSQVRFKSDIYNLVASKMDLTLIDNENVLDQEYIEFPWLPMTVCERRGVVALRQIDPDLFRYGTLDPYDVFLDDWVRRSSGMKTEKALVMPEVFDTIINKIKNQVTDEEANEIGIAINITTDQERWIQTNIINVDVPQLVNYFIHRGYTRGASDIHVEPAEEALATRNRIDGILHEDTNLPLSLHPEIISRIKIISGMDVAEKRRPQDGRIGLVIRGIPIDVRVSSYPTVYGEKVVMRLLDRSALRPSPESLGLLATGLQKLKDKISAPYGLIMISGPTGSGKTTTLYSCLGSIDKRAKNVLTVEDPVEYRLAGVHQMQVNEKIGLTFASGLRTILRQDPDVIMIGECRDMETAAMAIQASLTGHIVFSTIHTNDAVGVVTRLLDMGIDPFLVANSLSLAVAQRLVRRVCRHCQTTISGSSVLENLYKEGVSEERLNALGMDVDPDLTYIVGAGCIHCSNTGYLGRQAVFEVFEMTSEVRGMIMTDNFSADSIRKVALDSGMLTLVQHGLHFVDEGVTTHEEVLRVLGESS